MKRCLLYILPLLLAAVSCREESRVSGLLDAEIKLSGGQISDTKGFLESGDLEVNLTRVKVYDALTGFNGAVNGTEYSSSNYYMYIDDVVTYNGGTYWPYMTVGTSYRWTRTGVHRFFGYLDYDQSYDDGEGFSTLNFFGSNPTLETDSSDPDFLTLTTPTYSFQSSSPQYDFVFSKNAVVRDAADNDHSTVVLPMKHMFTAVSLCFVNNSSSTNVQITDISTLYQGNDLFLHKGYATVDYSSNDTDIQPVYHLEGDTTRPFFSASAISGTTIVPGKKYDLITGQELIGNAPSAYRMTWPLTQEQISPDEIEGYDIFGDPIYRESNKILALSYRANGGAVETARVKFPSKAWRAGTKVQLVINFTDKSIEMVAQVLPWDFNQHEMNFNGESILMGQDGKVTVVDVETHGDNPTVHLTTAQPEVTCRMEVSSPTGATLVINKIGPDPAYFTVEPNTLTINGGVLRFVVKPSELATGGVERSIRLSFSVALPSGREIDGDSEIKGNDHDYTFSRQ